MSRPPVTVQAKENATAVLIFLHGLGDTGHGWGELFKEFSLKNVRCIFPHAPASSVSLNGGMVMPSWFDIKGLTPNSPEDEAGVKESSKTLQQLIAEEIKKGIPAERIFIGGFSQGGAVALYTAFGTDTTIGGVLALSSWIPLHKHFADDSKQKYNKSVPVFQCHGQVDPMVSYIWGKASHEIIKKFNSDAQFKTFSSLGHGSSQEEMKEVKAFLEEHLKDS